MAPDLTRLLAAGETVVVAVAEPVAAAVVVAAVASIHCNAADSEH